MLCIVKEVFNERKIKIKNVGSNLVILKLTYIYIKAKDMSMDIIVNIVYIIFGKDTSTKTTKQIDSQYQYDYWYNNYTYAYTCIMLNHNPVTIIYYSIYIYAGK